MSDWRTRIDAVREILATLDHPLLARDSAAQRVVLSFALDLEGIGLDRVAAVNGAATLVEAALAAQVAARDGFKEGTATC